MCICMVWASVSMHIHARVCVCVWRGIHVAQLCGQRSSQRFQSLPSTLLRQASCSAASSNSPVCFLLAVRTLGFHKFWGLKVRSLCSHRKCFTPWTIFPTPSWRCSMSKFALDNWALGIESKCWPFVSSPECERDVLVKFGELGCWWWWCGDPVYHVADIHEDGAEQWAESWHYS